MAELDFAPDFSPYIPGNLINLADFVPTVTGSYATTGGPLQESYAALTGADALGAAIVRNKTGNTFLYAGTQTKLFQADGVNAWVDRSAKVYSTATNGKWEFLQFGNTTLAANGADTLQGASGGAFADVATAPICRSLIGHENAVIALNLSTDPAGWARSDTGTTSFTVAAANDADSGTFLLGSGPVTAGTSFGNLAIAFKGDWVYGGRFTGDAQQKVRWDTISKGVGCVGQFAHITIEEGVIFVSNRDVMIYDGNRVSSIADKVRRSFLLSMNQSSKAQIFMTHDEVDRCIYIWVPGSGQTYPTLAWVYNYKTGKWGKLNSISSASNTYSYVSCPVRAANYTDYLAVGGVSGNTGFSCNAAFVHTAGGGRLVNYERESGSNSNSASRSGTPTMTTGYLGDTQQDSRILNMFPRSEGLAGSLALASGSVNTLNANMTTVNSVPGAVNTDGTLNVESQGRFHSVVLNWTSGSANNFDVRSLDPQLIVGGAR